MKVPKPSFKMLRESECKYSKDFTVLHNPREKNKRHVIEASIRNDLHVRGRIYFR